jgi:membrane associated rhomboid family serine protease
MSAPAPWLKLPTGITNGVGIYDRDYYRQTQSGFSLRMPQTMVVTLIIINVVLYVTDGLLFPGRWLADHKLTYMLCLHGDTLSHPLMWWQFLTYGFAHDPQSIMHIVANMLGLFFLGRTVEQIYGSKEFLRVYLVMLLAGSISFALGNAVVSAITHGPASPPLLGASGAVSGITILFVLNFPNATLVLFPIPIPIKAWVMGVLIVVYNIYGTIAQSGNVAFGVHLAGIAFAWFYFHQRWNLGRLTENIFHKPAFLSKPKFRVHQPDEDSQEPNLNAEVDRILEKISREGESCLTKKERRTLETASREYQKRRQ